MKLYKLLLLFFLLGSVSHSNAQQFPETTEMYLRFQGAGLLPQETVHLKNERIVKVFTAGGLLNIQFSDEFKSKRQPILHFRTYFMENGRSVQEKEKTGTTLNYNKKLGEIYLNVEKSFIIEVLTDDDQQILKYIISRIELVPKVLLNWRNKSGKGGSDQLADGVTTGKITLSSDEQLSLKAIDTKFSSNNTVEYTLTNIKTRKTIHKVTNDTFGPLKLNPDTEYELRFRYTIQPETVRTYHITVKPHWYQTAIVYILGLVILTGIGLLIYTIVLKARIRTSKRKQERLEQAAFRLQGLLNPHFTFNALSSVQGLMNTGQIEEANNYLQEFSMLLRQSLTKSQQLFNSLDQELEMMRIYLKIEALRFNFSWNITVSPTLDIAATEIPTLLLQPIIENAVKHGLTGAGEKAHLWITCKEVPDTADFVIRIMDNGSWKSNEQHNGYGLSLTQERIRTINEMKNDQLIEMSLNKENGTEVVFKFHNWLN